MFEPELFPEQMYCIEKSNCDIVGTFLRPPPRSSSAPGALQPPRYAPTRKARPVYVFGVY